MRTDTYYTKWKTEHRYYCDSCGAKVDGSAPAEFLLPQEYYEKNLCPFCKHELTKKKTNQAENPVE